MRSGVVAIFINDSGWSLGRVGEDGVSLLPIEAEASSPAADLAAAVRATTEQAGAMLRTVVLAMPSARCYAASIATDGVVRRNRHAALLYRLEEFLPMDAETLTADFVGSGRQTLGVATLSQHVLEIVEALEAEDISVCSICPTPLLALQRIIQDHAGQHEACLLVEDGRFDLITVSEARPSSWRHGPLRGKSLRRQVEQLTLQREEPLPLTVVADDPALVHAMLPSEPGLETTEIATVPRIAAIEAAQQVVEDGEAAWIELRRDRLAMKDRLTRVKTPLRFAAAAIAFLLISVTAVSLWRGAQYQAIAQEQHQQQESLFREAFPGQDVPLMVLARFRSEQRRLKGMSGLSGDLPEQPSALSMLHGALAALPRDMRYRVLELRLDPGRIYLDGQARSHGDADLIAASLRRNGAFTLEPPRTENLPDQGGTSGGGGVVFTLTGTPGNPASVPGSTPASAPGPRKSPPKTAPGEQTTEQHQEMARASDAGDTP